MRNSRQRRNISLAILAVSIPTDIVTLALNRGSPGPGPGGWFGIVIAAFFLSLLAIVGIISFQFNYSRFKRLLRGNRRLTQWTLTQTEWAQFAVDDKTRRDAGRSNDIKLRPDQNSRAIEVIIAEDAILIDDDFFHLGQMRGLQWLPDKLPCLEYNMVTAGKNGSVRWNIRFPVAAGREVEARKVWDYVFRPGVAPNIERRLKRFRAARISGLIVAMVCAPLLVYAEINHGNRELQTPVVVCLTIGLLGVPLGLFISGLTHALLGSALRDAPAAASTRMPP